jgi:hypothetical protein
VTGCKSIQQKIEADIWLNDKEGFIYRIIKCTKEMEEQGQCKKGEKMEERIDRTHPAIEQYLCMHRDDFQKWLDLLTKPKEK